jgi:hypothetical protein
MVDVIPANQLVLSDAFIKRAWKHIVKMMQTGIETQPNASPQ